ncbi:MAG: hypothetical protein ABIZ56_10610 [Chthoniobacteraceae bacterium]
MSRSISVAAVSLLAGAVLGAGAMWTIERAGTLDLARQAKRAAMLTEENARLHGLVEASEKAKAMAANKAQREEIERQVIAIRGLTFKTPVDYNVLTRQQIKATISGKLAEVFSEQEFADMTAALAVLGLLPEGFPLRQKYIDLLGEQVAAFYDQHQHKLFMYEDASLENSQNRVVLAHELTHALQDQHFGLKRLPLEIKTNDDMAAAASALVEGEATLVMSEYMMKNLSLKALKDNAVASITQNMSELSSAPRYLREMLVFPYLRGQEFCSSLYGGGGYAAVSAAYERPPTSTAQILHPEKFFRDPREEPTAIEWPDVMVNGKKPVADNVLGEMGMRIQIAQYTDDRTGEDAANGWRGDRYLCYESGRGFAWKSVWASEADAADFAAAQMKVIAARKDRAARRMEVKQTGVSVLLIDAADEEWLRTLTEKFSER